MYTILDTNILLLDANNIYLTEGITVVSDTVLAELDAKKNGFDEINFQARAFARLIESANNLGMTRDNDMIVTKLELNGKEIHIVSLNKYKADPLSYGGNDARIIEVTSAYSKLYKDSVLMTNDMLMKFQAAAAGLTITSLKMVDDREVKFTKEFLVSDPEVFRTLHNSSILEVDSEYLIENYSYKFTCGTTNQMKLATIQNGFITVIGKDTETQLRKQRCTPINSEQLLLSKAIQDSSIDLVLVEGLAGSGKNISAVSNAIKLLESNRDKYQSIAYIRSPQNDESDKGEEIGFLAGNAEKLAMYLGPMEDTIDFIVRNEIVTKGKKKDEIDALVEEKTAKLINDCGIESMISTGLRGRTFHNTIVIVDEAQNAAPATMQKVLTRVGKNCKVLVIGSQRQIDSSYVNKYNNGLALLMNEAGVKSVDTTIGMFAITLHKVVRSEMSKFAEGLFSKS